MSDAIVDSGKVYACVFCGGVFSVPQDTGAKIVCEANVGGCGQAFRITTFPPPKDGGGDGQG